MSLFWLEKHLNQWDSAIKLDHKPQAVIVSGLNGTGKAELLRQIIADLICRQTNSGHCGTCQNCVLNQQGHHPDVYQIEPEKNTVKVKMIRGLTDFFTSTPHCSDYKIAVIEQADQMNVAAANALLKSLEEPPSRGLLFLVTDSKHQLMPTIKSRCVSLDVAINLDEKKQLKQWIKTELAALGNETNRVDDRLAEEALTVSDYCPKTALKILQENRLDELKTWLDGLYGVFNHDLSVSDVAQKILASENLNNWKLVQRYCVQLLKAKLNSNHHEIYASHPLNQLIKRTPKVVHIIIKMTELIQQLMLNFNTQIKDQLLLESMLVEIKSELNPRS